MSEATENAGARADLSHSAWRVTYHVRLREEGPHYGGSGEVRLINEGSSVEGSVEEQENEGAGSTHTFGRGTALVLNPGANSGSVGHLFITDKGERAKYQFEMWPDPDSEFFPTTIRWFNADPTHSNTGRPSADSEGKAIFRPVPIPPGGDQSARLATGGGRLMEGEYTFALEGVALQKTSWNLRAEIGPCDRQRDLGGAPPPANDACGPPTSQLALLNLALDQERALLELNGQQYRDIRQLQQQARQWQNDYDQASRDCKLFQVAKFLTNFLVGNEAGTIGKAGKELSNFLSFLDKMASGDPSWILPNTEFKEYFSVEDAWEAFQNAYGLIAPDSTPEGLLAGLRSCGSPTISGVMEGAVTYLRLLQQIEPKAREANKTLNDIRDKDQEVLNRWNDYHKACVDRANCKGTDPKACDAPPPQ